MKVNKTKIAIVVILLILIITVLILLLKKKKSSDNGGGGYKFSCDEGKCQNTSNGKYDSIADCQKNAKPEHPCFKQNNRFYGMCIRNV